MIAYVTDADYEKVKANQENFTITFQSKNHPPMKVEVKAGTASNIAQKPKRENAYFELLIEDDGLGKVNMTPTNCGIYPAVIIEALEIEIHGLIEQAIHSIKFDRTVINPGDNTITKIEDKEHNNAEN